MRGDWVGPDKVSSRTLSEMWMPLVQSTDTASLITPWKVMGGSMSLKRVLNASSPSILADSSSAFRAELRRKFTRIAKRVHMSLSRGKDSWVIASRTLDLPLDCSPMMAIRGMLSLWASPRLWILLILSLTLWCAESSLNMVRCVF